MTECESTRTVRVNCDSNGHPLGVAIFLSARELAALGFDPTTTDCIAYRIVNGAVEVVPEAKEAQS